MRSIERKEEEVTKRVHRKDQKLKKREGILRRIANCDEKGIGRG